MSRVAKMPVVLAKGVTFSQSGNTVTLKGSKGSLSLDLQTGITVVEEADELLVKVDSDDRLLVAMAGTTRALLANMVTGVGEGFERKLQLVGVGYRAAAQGNTLNLTLGFSHPVVYAIPGRRFHRNTQLRPRSWCVATTSRKLVRSPQTFALTVRRSLTRARAFATRMSV